jgi:hypothetical protein
MEEFLRFQAGFERYHSVHKPGLRGKTHRRS